MEKEVLVLMLLSVFSLMSVALSPTKNYILERQMLDACGIQAIANISRMQWQSSKDHVLRGYDFAYDGLNRLEESTFEKYFDTKEYADGSTATVGGATDNNQNIVMNVNFDREKNRLHEIFHTFGFEHPKMKGGSSGIMCYPPRSPNAKNAQLFGSDLLNDVLPFIKKEK